MRTVKKIVTYIIALILSISIIGFILINLLSSTILDEKYILSKLDETNYYHQIYELVESNFENYIQQSGLDEDVIKNIVTEEKVKEDTKQILINMYDGLNEKITTEDIEDKLYKNIEESLAGRKLTTDEQESIDAFVQKICDEYKTTILHTNYEEQINNAYQKITKYENILKKALSITIGVSIILLILVNAKRIYRTVSATGISLIASGAILIIGNLYLNAKVKIQTIIILNDAFSILTKNIVNEILKNIWNYGCLLILFGVLLIVVSNLIHNIRKYKTKE